MPVFEFTFEANRDDCPEDDKAYDEWLLQATEDLCEQIDGNPDVFITGRNEGGLRIEFEREADSLEQAVASALRDIKVAGLTPLTADFVSAETAVA